MTAHEVVLQSSTPAVLRWLRRRPELSHLGPAGHRREAAAVRVLGRMAIRRVLAAAGMPAELFPALSEIRITADPFGRPVVDLPARAADWMCSGRLGLDLSLSHAGHQLLAVALAAP
jgi:phosphopantetheinyl transferase (holo-ACP synthase)